MIQYITLRFNELDHFPQCLHRQHLRLTKGVDFRSPHKRELLQLDIRINIRGSLSIGPESNDSEQRTVTETPTLLL